MWGGVWSRPFIILDILEVEGTPACLVPEEARRGPQTGTEGMEAWMAELSSGFWALSCNSLQKQELAFN